MRPANERRRYNVTLSLIGWVYKQNDPCCCIPGSSVLKSRRHSGVVTSFGVILTNCLHVCPVLCLFRTELNIKIMILSLKRWKLIVNLSHCGPTTGRNFIHELVRIPFCSPDTVPPGPALMMLISCCSAALPKSKLGSYNGSCGISMGISIVQERPL